jgi:hypothetical protein
VTTPDVSLLHLSAGIRRAVLVAGALMACWAPAAGQQPALDTVPPGLEPAGMALDSATLGARRGLEAARYESTQGWIWGGFAGGLTLGPIGAGLAWTLANNSDVALGVDRRMLLQYDGGSTYIEAFERLTPRRCSRAGNSLRCEGGFSGQQASSPRQPWSGRSIITIDPRLDLRRLERLLDFGTGARERPRSISRLPRA